MIKAFDEGDHDEKYQDSMGRKKSRCDGHFGHDLKVMKMNGDELRVLSCLLDMIRLKVGHAVIGSTLSVPERAPFHFKSFRLTQL